MVDTFPVSVNFSAQPEKYARGGLNEAANRVSKAGQHDDTMIVHINKDEYEWMKQQFGEPKINPQTGVPAFGFWDDIKDWAGPAVGIGATLLGAGDYVGSGVNDALGLGLSPTATTAVGSGLLGAGAGLLTGGGAKGALIGGLAGGASPYVLNALGFGAAPSVGSAAANAATTAGGVRDASIADATGATGGNAGANVAAKGGSSIFSSMLGGKGGFDLMKMAPLLLLGAAALGSGGSKKTGVAGQDDGGGGDNYGQNRHLSNIPFDRQQTAYKVDTNYGYGPQQSFFNNNRLPAAQGRYVKGGGTGTSDSIPAVLSDGEYVIDAQTVSMLGDGSSDAGAKKLDEMRENIRKHKGKSLAQGKFAPSAKGPLSYVKGA